MLIGDSTLLRLHDSRRGDVTFDFDLAGRVVRDADLSPDGRLDAAACENPSAVGLWDSRSGRQLHVLNEHRYSAIHVRFSPDSKRLLSGGNDAPAVLWDVETGELIRRFPCPTEVRGSAFNADDLNHLWLLENLRTLIVPDSVELAQLDRLSRLPNLEIIRRDVPRPLAPQE